MSGNAEAISYHPLPVSVAQSKAYVVNDGQWPQYSGFEVLRSDRREIRLLQLETMSKAHSMRYKMVHASLQQAPEYSAVSYCWGAPVPIGGLKEIYVNGLSVRIRPTLYSFLETLTIRYPGTSLWIDAICINQSDDSERNHQISIMGEIFGAAQEVLVWLGSGDDDLSYAMDHIGNSQPQTTYNPLIFSDCAEKLLQATYWTRRWVIQEFALAKKIKVVCGSYLTGWENITDKITDEVLRNEPSLQQKLELFKSSRSPVLRTMTLLI
jgi:hypothetical protein